MMPVPQAALHLFIPKKSGPQQSKAHTGTGNATRKRKEGPKKHGRQQRSYQYMDQAALEDEVQQLHDLPVFTTQPSLSYLLFGNAAAVKQLRADCCASVDVLVVLAPPSAPYRAHDELWA